MFSNLDNEAINRIIKSNTEFETIVQSITDNNKNIMSTLVHELRNPLALIKCTLQYIENKHPQTKDYKYWNQLPDLISDMEHLMTDASLYYTCSDINKSACNLLTIINGVINNYMPLINNQCIDFSFIVEPRSEPYFASYNCDAIKLKQVFSNLIKNAVEASPDKGFIHIYCKFILGHTNALSINISNNGPAIPEDVIGNIFMPFVSNKKGGMGIGLALAKRIIDLHYGSINVTSNEELTMFTILLPIN